MPRQFRKSALRSAPSEPQQDQAASLTIWEDRGAVEAVKSSPSYRRVVRELVGRDLLAGEQSEEVFEVEGGDLRAETLLGALGS